MNRAISLREHTTKAVKSRVCSHSFSLLNSSVKRVKLLNCKHRSPEAETLRGPNLWMHWRPNALWDDRVLCMPGQNKNQDNSDIDIDSVYTVIIKESNMQSGQTNIQTNHINVNQISLSDKVQNISVYPNPANSYIVVSYQTKNNGVFTLYNSLGEIVLKTELSMQNTKTQIPLLNIANGLYHYEVEFVSMKKTIGKLSIVK